jgi:hypothetical protein
MRKSTIKTVFFLLLITAVLLTALGGWLDMTHQEEVWIVSKAHAWNDGLFTLGLAALIYIMYLR